MCIRDSSRAVRVDDRLFIAGTTALKKDGTVASPGDVYGQSQYAMETIREILEEAGGTFGDLVYSKTFLTDMTQASAHQRARMEALGDVRPPLTLLGIPGVQFPEIMVEIETEAIIGSAQDRKIIYTENQAEKARGYARAVQVGDVILADVSGEEVESYLLQEEIVKPIETDLDVATDRGCSDEEHAAMRAEAATQWTNFSSE